MEAMIWILAIVSCNHSAKGHKTLKVYSRHTPGFKGLLPFQD